MLFSDVRKRTLSGWLFKNARNVYNSSLKLQKFLFFYEGLCLSQDRRYDFSSLQGWKNGPVFSSVWGDRFHNPSEFSEAIISAYDDNLNLVNEEIAKKSAFLVKIMSPNALAEFTHTFNVWKAKEHEIMVLEESRVKLSEKDINLDDIQFFKYLYELYDETMIDTTEVYIWGDHSFLFSKDDFARLTPDHFSTMKELVEMNNVDTISYVELDDDGVMLID